jgi:glycosyltransferase involved in cell wall biosynthesis
MADIFTLPSIPVDYWQEQFGIVLIESMASGKPIVTTISGSIPEVVGDAAVLVQPADHLALYHAFKDLVLSKEKCRSLGNRARARAEELFSLDVVSERLRRAIRSTLNVTQ